VKHDGIGNGRAEASGRICASVPTLYAVLSKCIVVFDRLIGRRFYRLHRVVYRWTGGFIGHRSPAGPMLLLTTTGRKSGQPRVTPLLYMADGPRFMVVGSNAGREHPPAWLLNLSVTPSVEVQVGRHRHHAAAHVLTTDEKAAIWPALAVHYKGWDDYQELTDRELNVVALLPDKGVRQAG
jgi:F420H(2)-dependent quinone reductase